MANLCEHCVLDLKAAASGDLFEVSVMFVFAPVTSSLALGVDVIFGPSVWAHMLP